MPSVNRVVLLGHLGRDAELRFTPSGKSVLNFSVATSDKWKNANGEPQERTEWTNVVYWGKMAESVAPLLRKGSLAYVEGQKETRSYKAKDGTDKTAVEVKASLVLECRWRGEVEPERGQQTAPYDDTDGGF